VDVKALGIDQSLLALVVRGREMQVGPGNFDVVAEDVVEAVLSEAMLVRLRSRSSMEAMICLPVLAEVCAARRARRGSRCG